MSALEPEPTGTDRRDRSGSPHDPPTPTYLLAGGDEPRNVAALALNAMVFRMGWVFKTESVLMPAFLDHVAGAAWVRGLLPILNRMGLSVPAFLMSRRVAEQPRLSPLFGLATFGAALPWLLLAGTLAWLGEPTPGWLPGFFLLLYGLFFCVTGFHSLTTGALTGKLVRPQRRGRLLALSTVGGMLPAALAAWWLLPGWLAMPGNEGWVRIFLCTGTFFLLASMAALLLREPASTGPTPIEDQPGVLREGIQRLREDGAFRRLVLVSCLFNASIMLIPHYQALAREGVGLGGEQLMIWVVVQNTSAAIASAWAGPAADRRGNRYGLTIALGVVTAVPLLALLAPQLPEGLGAPLFWLVFAGMGWTPVGMRLIANFVLELSEESRQAQSLAVLQLCNAGVMFLSPLLGAAIDLAGFSPVFLATSGSVAIACALTRTLSDPRHAAATAPPRSAGPPPGPPPNH